MNTIFDTSIYIKYQAYGNFNQLLKGKLASLNHVERPAVSTVIRLVRETEAELQGLTPKYDVNIGMSCNELIDTKLKAEQIQVYYNNITEATENHLAALRVLIRPTKSKIEKTIDSVLDNVIKDLLMVY
jgi:hypothetical protein